MYARLIKLQKNSTPLYEQILEQTIRLISSGLLPADLKLPGTRKLAELWGVNRQTVIAAFDELLLQGWIATVPGGGTYICAYGQDNPTRFEMKNDKSETLSLGHAAIPMSGTLPKPVLQKYHLDDGLPDPALAPVKELQRAYKTALQKTTNLYGYADLQGSPVLREALVPYLLKTRGLKVTPAQILITRGVTQALYLAVNSFINPGDHVAVPALNWAVGNTTFTLKGAHIHLIKLDEYGLDAAHLQQIAERYPLKMLYLTPHHQYPTTVIMPATRRVQVLELAQRYAFRIFEDDYDYDFHYAGLPLMPLAAAGHQGTVLYAGSFTKALSPAFRVGYLVATTEQIQHMSALRRLVDRQGDPLLELALAELLQTDIILRSIRKALKTYSQRRTLFANLLKHHFGDLLTYDLPEGGLSIWTKFDASIDLPGTAEKALTKNLYISDGTQFNLDRHHQATRLGFASSTEHELEVAVGLLRESIVSW